MAFYYCDNCKKKTDTKKLNISYKMIDYQLVCNKCYDKENKSNEKGGGVIGL